MKTLLNERLIGVALAAFAAGSGAAQTPQLRAGVSVQMPVTRNAIAAPDADRGDSLIVAVTREGKAYLEITPVTPTALQEALKSALAGRSVNTVYIKADARTPFASVAAILESASKAGADAPVLLTQQRDASDAGKTPVPPKGLAVVTAAPRSSAPAPVVIEARNEGQNSPALAVDGQVVPFAGLPAAIAQSARNGRAIVVRADPLLPFGDVAGIVDSCRPSAAPIYLLTSSR